MALTPILNFEVHEFPSLVVRSALLGYAVLHRLVFLCSPYLSSCRHWFQGSNAKRARNFLHRKNEALASHLEWVQLQFAMRLCAPVNTYLSLKETFRNRLCLFLQSITNNVQALDLNGAVDHPYLCNFQRWLFHVALCQRSNALVLGNGEHCRFAGSTIPPVAHHNTIPKQSDEQTVALHLLSKCHNLFDLCGHSIANIHQFLLPFAIVVRREIVLSCDGITLPKVSIA